MSRPISPNTEAAILERMIEPQTKTFDPGLARYVLSLDFKPDDHERMNELSAKAQEGKLTGDEKQELDSYLNLGHFLALLQSKSRITLQHAQGAA